MKAQRQLILVFFLVLPLETFSQSALPSPFLNENVDSQSASATQIKFTQKKKNKIVNFAEAQLSHGKGKVKLVFDSAQLSPGQYQVLLSPSCQSSEKNQWNLGSFKTNSGHISTEFIVDHNESKWSFSTQNQALVIRKVEKKNGKSTIITCAEFLLPTEPVLAADGL